MLTRSEVIEALKEDILIHDRWAWYVTEYPSYAEAFGDYEFHMYWIKVYESAIHHLKQPHRFDWLCRIMGHFRK